MLFHYVCIYCILIMYCYEYSDLFIIITIISGILCQLFLHCF